ncbi:hypothetical protein BKA64DRAFT_690569 [Cadophora sp. MPI-SDFR-AT-0126]|nr:hypothetical protein BKA64DRAFT_690569 [Leotiomycetes sp. MPI-SDFR-AT-0126]
MPASFEEILSSRIFKFTVGQNVDGVATTFSVHEEAVAALSQPLHTLMRSGLEESEAGHATWEDVSKDTFVRFAQFAYTGDYSVPALVLPVIEHDPPPDVVEEPVAEEEPVAAEEEPVAAEAEPVAEEAEPVAEEEPVVEESGLWEAPFDMPRDPGEVVEAVEVVDGDSWGFGSRRTAVKKSKKKNLPRVIDGWSSVPLPLNVTRNNYAGTCDPSDSFEPWFDYSASFVSHASLWILGDYRNIASLKELALYKLHKTLSAFQLSSENVDALIDLVKCAYSEEGAGLGEGISGLRKLVCQYLGGHKALLCEDDGFMDLLGDGGQFVKDFFKYSSA